MKRNQYEVKTQNTMVYIMLGAMTLLSNYLAYIIPVVGFAFYAVSALFVVCVMADEKPLAAIILYLIVSGLSLVILPIPYAMPYIIVFGHYGIAKEFIGRIKDKPIRIVLKLVYFNAFCALMYFLVIESGFLKLDISLPLWAIILILQAGFAVLEGAMALVKRAYIDTWRKKLSQ